MMTALDTNILSPVLSGAPTAATIIAELLRARFQGALVISGPVFVELAAIPGLDLERTEKALKQSSIAVDFDIGEDIWRLAAGSFSAYAMRRRRSSGGSPKRLLTDFVIAAHALLRADRLMTLDPARYKLDFPTLHLV